uniref:Uncharacterized protein n=1 Tax=Arundo donax TaxID=35708 RepID=A0A0A9A430_ARUDO
MRSKLIFQGRSGRFVLIWLGVGEVQGCSSGQAVIRLAEEKENQSKERKECSMLDQIHIAELQVL